MAGVEAPERFPAAHRPCQPAPVDALEAAHAPRYLESLEELSARGGGYVDFDTALSQDSWEAATLAAGAAVGAVESALEGTAAFAIARPPGHHAGRVYGMGFCLLNNAAVAAQYARSRGLDKVAILDWDVHHGNGTQDIFYGSEEVLSLSAHQSPFYPGTGDAREAGEGRGKGFTGNVPLPGRSGEDLYAEAFAGFFVPILREYHPELLLVSAGYDSHSDDLLGGMRLESATFGRFAARLATLTREIGAAPPVFLLEGGYNLNALTESVAATIVGIEEQPPDWEYSGDARPVEAARKALS